MCRISDLIKNEVKFTNTYVKINLIKTIVATFRRVSRCGWAKLHAKSTPYN